MKRENGNEKNMIKNEKRKWKLKNDNSWKEKMEMNKNGKKNVKNDKKKWR